MNDKSKKSEPVLVPLPPGYESRPFVLIWTEKAAAEKLKAGGSAFSEAVRGLSAQHFGEPESLETTGSSPEAADTTITF